MNLRRFTHRRRKDEELALEIESHLAHAQDANTDRGLPEAESRRQARLRFGNPQVARERVWRYRSLPFCEDFWRDLRFAVRSLRKTPDFAAMAIGLFAVGIGVNTAVFSVINAVLLKPLTYPDPQAIVQLMNTGPRGSFPGANVPKFETWQRQSNVFAEVAGYDFGGAGMNLTGSDHPQQVQGVHVTADYFRLFGASPVAGRTFSATEDSPNGGRVVVLSYGLWAGHFGADPKMVGSTIELDGKPYQVIGVIGRHFHFEAPADLWVPFQFDPASIDMAHYFTVSARLRPGTTLQQANAQLRLAAEQYRRTYGSNALPAQEGFGALPLQELLVSDARSSLFVLLGAVAFVLLIACGNIANLLLAKASTRRRELATRAALGASRGQIIWQLLTESLIVCVPGGVLGLGLGFAGVRLLLSFSPSNLPRLGEGGSAVTLDTRVLLFTLALSIVTGILASLVPAIGASRSSLAPALHESSSRAGISIRGATVRSALVVGEMALALVLLIGAVLLIRTFIKLRAVDPGFISHNVLTMTMAVSGDRFQKTAPVAEILRNGRERVLRLPGVIDVGVTNNLPLQGGFVMSFDILNRPKGSAPATGGAGYHSVSQGYFETLKIPVERGRAFGSRDDTASPAVVVINAAMARQFWPSSDPLKDRLQIGVGAGPMFAEAPRQVIGIVGDTRDNGLNRDPFPTMYIPLAQMPDRETALNSRVTPLWWVIRSHSEPHLLASPISAALREVSGGLPVGHVQSMDEIEVSTMASQRLNMLLLTSFGFAGLLMATVGVYGVMSYSVQQRTQELGVRMALGATASNLRRTVISQGMTLACVGVVIGLMAGFFLTRFLTGFLFGVKASDPIAFILTPAILAAVALLAVWVPARRATRVDPISALRVE